MEIFLGCVCLDGRYQTCRVFASVATLPFSPLKKKKKSLGEFSWIYVCMYVCISILVGGKACCMQLIPIRPLPVFMLLRANPLVFMLLRT